MSEETTTTTVEEPTTTAEPVVEEQPSFLNSLPEELRNDNSMKDIKDIESMAKSYISAQRMLGNSVRIPTEDSSKEDYSKFYEKITSALPNVKVLPDGDEESLSKFYNQLGRPETHEGYKLSEDIKLGDDTQLNTFKQEAHKLGITNKQFEALIKFDLQRSQSQVENESNKIEQNAEQLKKLWGSDYEVRLRGANQALKHYQGQFPDAVNEIAQSSLGSNPAVIAMLSEMGKMLSEKGVQNVDGNIKYGMTPEEASDKFSEILDNREHAYWNSSDPNHSNAMKKVAKLLKIADSNK